MAATLWLELVLGAAAALPSTEVQPLQPIDPSLFGATCRENCPIRWMHAPKTGSTFANTVLKYACDVPDDQIITGCNVDCKMAYAKDPAKCPRMWNAEGEMYLNHEPLKDSDLGHVIGNFRHPRARIASFCRHGGWTNQVLRNKTDMLECNDITISNRHLAVMTHIVLGNWLPGCGNGVEPMAKFANSTEQEGELLATALRRLHENFAFVGVTEAWDDSVRAFHALFMPGLEVSALELEMQGFNNERALVGPSNSTSDGKEGKDEKSKDHPAAQKDEKTPKYDEKRGTAVNKEVTTLDAKPHQQFDGHSEGVEYLESAADQRNTNAVEVDLRYDQKWFPNPSQHEVLKKDPDLLLFAHARLIFCRMVHQLSVSAEGPSSGSSPPPLPEVCVRSLGALVEGTSDEQITWATHLVNERWRATLDAGPYDSDAVIASLAGKDLTEIVSAAPVWTAPPLLAATLDDTLNAEAPSGPAA